MSLASRPGRSLGVSLASRPGWEQVLFLELVNGPCKPSVALRHTYVVLRMRSTQ